MQRATPAQTAGYFFRLGLTGFGGPVALANYMRVDLVERRQWMTSLEYEEGLAIASACPGPLAYQLGVYCGFIMHGLAGALAVAVAFALGPFVVVCLAAMAYMRFGSTPQVHGLFWGVAPVVVALIAKSCWALGKTTLRREPLAWIFAAVACAITVGVQKELVAVFLVAGVLGIALFRPAVRSDVSLASIAPWGLSGVPAAKIFLFFLKTGFLVFGSGLVIVPFLKSYIVDGYHWLNNPAFVDSVAIGIVSPGPVVITATFVGFLLANFTGALAATAGIFLPSLVFVVLGTPLLRRHRSNPSLQGFIRGVTTAVVGVLIGTSYLIARSSLHDWRSLLLLGISLAVLFSRWKIPDQALIGAGAVLGLTLATAGAL